MITSTSLCACFGYSSRNSCVHKGLHAGKWPDLMTSKTYYLSTLGYHWTNYTGTILADAVTQWSSVATQRSSFSLLERIGRPLESQVHWDANGTTLADASTQCCSSGNRVLLCIIRKHWKTTGGPLEAVAFQCTLGYKFRAHWIATGLPLNGHWPRVRAMAFTVTSMAPEVTIWLFYPQWTKPEKCSKFVE